MKLLVVAALVVHAASAVSFFSLGPNFSQLNRLEAAADSWEQMVAFQEWYEFKETHEKAYGSEEEESFRLSIYNQNKKLVNDHNLRYELGQHSYKLKLNQFADLTASEYAKMMNGYQHERKRRGEAPVHLPLAPEIRLPATVDWRNKGAVTPVKDQGQCGSCWAFSSTGALEGQHFRKTGRLVSLSEQNLVDCSTSFGNNGCDGGLMDDAFKYVKANGGIDTEASYPYEAEDDTCRFNKQDVGATDKGYMDIPEGDEQALKEAVAVHGPISIAIDASQSSFQFYHSGVYDDPNCSSMQLDHGVLAVGYGSEGGRDYWLVKNSWSENWGDQGYIKIARNENNVCGVASSASFPLV
ncbi:procathepsin L-like [Amphibalanus amphitrite]|uniref:procathepsin L-like n=1 Tax=Amphibalanus amphitrite TaxID=1232801 RepID=UPI001C920E8F|nr:procathepsin L-like [Amphibalanus amphitrite]